MKRSIVYCRVSGTTQEKDGSSLDTQREACLAFAESQGYEVNEEDIILETYSGLTLERPQLTALRGRVKDGAVSAIVVHTPDRLSRVGEDILALVKEFKIAGVKSLFVKEKWDDTLNGKLVAFVFGWASELEAAQFKERSTRGKIARAKEGRLPGGKNSKLFGHSYLAGKGQGEGKRYIKEDEAKWVREIYKWYAEEGLSIYRILLRLGALGVKSPSGNNHWCTGTLHSILRNRAYIGETIWFKQSQGQVAPIEIAGATDPIVTEELFEKVQARLQQNKELSPRNAQREYLLRGHIYCSRCGRRYQGSFTIYDTKDGVKENRYYRCPSSYTISPKHCPNPRHNAKRLERVIWQEIDSVLSKPDVVLAGIKAIQDEASKANSHIAELETVGAKLRHMEKEKDRTWKAFELTGDEPKFTSEIRDITTRTEGLKRRKAELEKRIELASKAETDIDSIKKACEMVRSNLTGLSFENKRLALEALNVKVWLDGEAITIEGSIPTTDLAIVSTPA